MRTLKTSEAAATLNVSPNTLRSWERRFGFPSPRRTAGQHRVYTAGEILALRDALREGLSIASAISRAREALGGDAGTLTGALAALDLERADRAMEASLALRSLDRTVSEILLPAADVVAGRHGAGSAPFWLVADWGAEWLRRAARLSPRAPAAPRLLLGAAFGPDDAADRLAIAALDLLLGRAGVPATTVPVARLLGLAEIVERVPPSAVVVAGGSASDDDVSRWAHRVRAVTGPVPVFVFRRGLSARSTTGVLDPSPAVAAAQLAERICAEDARRPAAAGRAVRRVAS